MATPHLFLSILIIFSLNSVKISSSTSCTLNFTQFPYEAPGECLDMAKGSSARPPIPQSCCDSALQSLFQAMAIRTNQSQSDQSIFLESTEAQACISTFQSLHQRTNLAECQLQDHISSSTPNRCSENVGSVINILGADRYNAFRSDCKDLSMTNYSDEACFDCVKSYRESLQILKETRDSSGGKECGEALLLSLASSDVDSANWVTGTFSCLWDEIRSPWNVQNDKSSAEGFLLGSKKILVIVIVAAALAILAPILYAVTRKQLRHSSRKDIENLSVTVLKKKLEDESRSPFICSDLYIFSQEEMAKATNFFNPKNLIGEGSLGKVYAGVMPSGMRVAIKRLDEGNYKLHRITEEIYRKAKIRHPNLVSTLGCCDKGDVCLVYELCFNGDLSGWLFGDGRTPILSWEQRIHISIGIARGLCFLHTNPLEKIVHGDIKLSNILLNEKLEAKISDFITASYKPKDGNRLETRENDVFQFGIVLLQILTGRDPKSLVEEARDAMLKGESISSMADPRLHGAYFSTEFKNILSIAVLCTNPKEHERPNMLEVVRKLEEAQILV